MTVKVGLHKRSAHLDERSLLPERTACPCCGWQGHRPSLGTIQDDPVVWLLLCPHCAGVSVSRMPTDDALAEYYQDFHTAAGAALGEKVTFDHPDRFADHILSVLARRGVRIPRRGCMRILDFGGGDGTLAVQLADRLVAASQAESVDIVVVDFDLGALADARSPRVRVGHASAVPLEEGAFDVVLASASMEHVAAPKETLAQLLRSLASGGVFYARTPFAVPLFRLLGVFGVKLDLLFPAHLHDMGQQFWEAVPALLVPELRLEVLASRPAIVEKSFSEHFLRALTSHLLKAPWWLLRDHYALVGGWEIFLRRPTVDVETVEVTRERRETSGGAR